MAKILEKLILKQINRHRKEQQILIPEQFVFPQTHNTELRIVEIIDKNMPSEIDR